MDCEGSEDVATFSLPDHRDQLGSKLWQFQQEGRWCDLNLVGKDGSIGVHKVIVATFSSQLTSSKEWPGKCRALISYSVQNLQMLVRLIYTGQISVTPHTLEHLSSMLQALGKHDAANKCCLLFPSQITRQTMRESVDVKEESDVVGSQHASDCTPSESNRPALNDPIELQNKLCHKNQDALKQTLVLTECRGQSKSVTVNDSESSRGMRGQVSMQTPSVDGRKNKLDKILNKMVTNRTSVKKEPTTHASSNGGNDSNEQHICDVEVGEKEDENDGGEAEEDDAENDEQDHHEEEAEEYEDEASTDPLMATADSDADSDATVVDEGTLTPKLEPILPEVEKQPANNSHHMGAEETSETGRPRTRSCVAKSTANSTSINGSRCICSVGIQSKRLTTRSIRRHSRKCQSHLKKQKDAEPRVSQQEHLKAKTKVQRNTKPIKVKRNSSEAPKRPGRPKKDPDQSVDKDKQILSMGFIELTRNFSKSLSDTEESERLDATWASKDHDSHFSDDLHPSEDVSVNHQVGDEPECRDPPVDRTMPCTWIRSGHMTKTNPVSQDCNSSLGSELCSSGNGTTNSDFSGIYTSPDLGMKADDNGLFYLNNKCKIWLPKAQAEGEGNGNIFCACGGYYPPSLLPKHHAYCKIINYQCYRCLTFFVKESKLREHLSSCQFVTTKKYYQCSKCGKVFIDFDFMVIHYHMHRYVATVSKKLRELLKCQKCGQAFRAEQSLIDHLNQEHGANDTAEDNSINKIYRCTVPSVPACDFKTLLPYRMESHVFMVHSDEYPIECATCGKRFKIKQQCDNHQRFNHDHFGQLFHCPTCDKGFKSRSTLKGHRLIHAERKNILCDECPFQTKSPSILKSHKDSFHQDSIQFKSVTQDVKHYRCEYCDYSSIFRHKVATHVARHKANTEGIKHYQCEICGKRFPAKSNLRSHMVWHGDKVHKCPHEGCTFTSNHIRTVRNHITCRHMDYKPFSCAICGYSAKLRGNLILHLRNTHKLYVKTKGKLSKQEDPQVQDPRKEAVIIDNVARLKCDVEPNSLTESEEHAPVMDAKLGGLLRQKGEMSVPQSHPHMEMEQNVVHYLHGEGFSWADAVTWSANLS